MMVNMCVEKEYRRLKSLFDGCEEKQLELIDGMIWEAARLKVELDRMNEIVKRTGLIRINQSKPEMQQELPVSKMITRVRANYLNYIAKLSSILGKNIEDEDDELDEFE